ncbi:MoxR-like ATPase [Roseospira visakhapatnamensis]|uniref:MoxR-like ATPase n=1 Tax=Roseospira visakhapatnamensis TaxID=390880 RepID=A0A7W6RHJ2_9PROT|nr:MoxR-like ATPase [Roseospira visakhapatnamensis]
MNAALAAGRPLLVRGEPGTGKSQLARAAAKQLGRAFIPHVIDSHTESRDLLWNFDAVKRLADAQIAGSLGGTRAVLETELAVANYLHPGPLWWAFNWDHARQQAERAMASPPAQHDGGDWGNGCVVLLDEIDKGEADVPNGLLEALGARRFMPMGSLDPVCIGSTVPLVVITTNEERALPEAFLRRCMVLFLTLPDDEAALTDLLVQRGRAHFPKASDAVLRRAATLLIGDRRAAIAAQIRPFPGQAEYLDLLRAAIALAPGDKEAQLAMLDDIAQYALKKQHGV